MAGGSVPLSDVEGLVGRIGQATLPELTEEMLQE